MTRFSRLCPLNAVIDVEVAERAGWTPIDLAAAYLSGGARFLQIRAKTLSGAAFFDLSSRVCEITHSAGALLFVNDRADIARLSGADGLHVGQHDLTVAAARTILGPGARVGLSTHTEAQIDAAILQPLSYLAVGPVFGTSTKATGYTAVGLDRVRYAAEKVRRLSQRPRPGRPDAAADVPVVAIGGITLETAADAIAAGAASVAVITDLIATGAPESRVRAYLARLGACRGMGTRSE